VVSQDPCKKRKMSQGKIIVVKSPKSNDTHKAKPNPKPPKICLLGLAHLNTKKKVKKHFAIQIEGLFESQFHMFMTYKFDQTLFL
jgi:hypothetical protein